MTMIKTWRERCEEHPDHEGIVTERMIHSRMQEEIDELRQAIEDAVATEREACAKLAEEPYEFTSEEAHRIASAIRARGEQ
jgi:hypothetical protein